MFVCVLAFEREKKNEELSARESRRARELTFSLKFYSQSIELLSMMDLLKLM